MRRVLYRALAIPFFVGALAWLLFSPGPDCDPRRMFGCGVLDIGIGGVLGNMANYLIACLIAVPGVALWTRSG